MFVPTFVVWLLLLAVPFQGIAAAAVLSCTHGAPHAPGQQAAAAGGAGQGDAGHCHGAAMQQAPDTDEHPSPGHDGQCGACAACCPGAALAPAPALSAGPAPPSALPVCTSAARLAAVDLDHPERPPKPPLA